MAFNILFRLSIPAFLLEFPHNEYFYTIGASPNQPILDYISHASQNAIAKIIIYIAKITVYSYTMVMRVSECIKQDFFQCGFVTSDEPHHKYHNHAEYEIFYLLEGSSIVRHIEDREYIIDPHSLLLIPGGVFHEWRFFSKPCRSLSIHFLPEFLNNYERSLLLPLFDSRKACYIDKDHGMIDFFAYSLLECRDMESDIQRLALKSRMVSLLTHVHKLRKETATFPLPAVHDKRVRDIIEYLSCNLEKPISLDILSHSFAISKNYLNVLFKKETGATVSRYIRIQRLNFARHEILYGKSVEEAAYAAGFNYYPTFFRAYKALFGTAPTASRPLPVEQGLQLGVAHPGKPGLA
jgi:AraC-like DNA-binding protein/mannose-6-phosphate isomerase-like protein (cupin superfamily)